MILQFSVSNYRCFRKLQTLNLAASSQDKSLPDNCIVTDLPGLAGKRWVKGVALYGANASGKTTILEALEALAEMVRNSARMTDPKNQSRRSSHLLSPPESRRRPRHLPWLLWPKAFVTSTASPPRANESGTSPCALFRKQRSNFGSTAIGMPSPRNLLLVARSPDWFSTRPAARRLHTEQHPLSLESRGE